MINPKLTIEGSGLSPYPLRVRFQSPPFCHWVNKYPNDEFSCCDRNELKPRINQFQNLESSYFPLKTPIKNIHPKQDNIIEDIIDIQGKED